MKDLGNTLWDSFRKDGERRDFKALFDLYYSPLHRYSYFITGNSDDAEEVVMDFFLNIWTKRDTLDISGSFEAYARRSVHNLSLNHLRDRKGYLSADLSEAGELVSNFHIDLEEEELETLIWEAVSSMSEKCQKVYFMSRRDEMSDKAIAEELGLSVKSVEGYKTRVLKALRSLLSGKLLASIFI
ncbi:MAG: RNA polymerase sigma-70 factor [Bacteroidales bacterium]|nr:RNA polymerase sigma-70 factor [Bacteroidales bacterium]